MKEFLLGLVKHGFQQKQCDWALLGPACTEQSELGGSFSEEEASRHELQIEMSKVISSAEGLVLWAGGKVFT